jgi:hypothetical protein
MQAAEDGLAIAPGCEPEFENFKELIGLREYQQITRNAVPYRTDI